jgi:hypothetical protein
MSWNHDYRLEWSDFEGQPTEGTSVVAVTASGITFSFSTKKTRTRLVDYNYIVKADFYPEKSWYSKHRASNNILNHERLHFDITELFARKFRERIDNTRFNLSISSQMERIHNAINSELEAMQNLYDAETNHSQNIEKQKEWQAKIIIELNKLANYGS